jgi:hypothetical protein
MTPTGGEPSADFDRWLRRQLRAALDPELGPQPHPAGARYTAASRQTGDRRVTPIRFSITAALAAKALAGSAVVALAAGAAAGTVTTGSVNPTNWGQHVAQAVEQCRAADHDVGRCVSAIAQEHGELVRARNGEAVRNQTASPSPATPSSKPGQREGQETGQSSKGGNGAAASDGHGHGHATTPPTPAPTPHDDHGHGKPSPQP